MARLLKVAVAGLNIRLHPHSPELYSDYIQGLYSLKRPIQLRGDRHAMITMLDRRSIDVGIVRGMITSFTKIDMRGRWFDQESLDEAAPGLKSEIRIPANLHPNSATFRFSFDLRTHILTFEQYSGGRVFTPRSAYTLFERLSGDLDIIAKFGTALITIIQEKATLGRIFGISRLKTITFVIDRPNPDIWSDDLEGQIDAHLAATHAKQIEVTYTAPSGQGLQETPSLRRLGDTALRNGSVTAKGYEAKGKHVTISTINSPQIEQTNYDPDVESEEAAFYRASGALRQ